MDDHLNNPAGRLLLFLEHNKAAAGNTAIRSVWGDFVGLDESAQPVEFMSAMQPVLALPELVREEVSALDDPVMPVSELLQPLVAAEGALAFIMATDQAVNNVQAQYDAGTIWGLKACSFQLQKARVRFALTTEQLADIRSSAEGLIEAINNAGDLPFDVKRSLLEHAHGALRDVDSYTAGGAEPFTREADRISGQLMRDTNLQEHLNANPKLKEAFVHFWAAIGIITTGFHMPLGIIEDVQGYQELARPSTGINVIAPSATDSAIESSKTATPDVGLPGSPE